MAQYAFTLDEVGGAEVLKEIAAEPIAAYMQRIANIIGPAATVEIVAASGSARRARAKVTVPAELQAKDGVLTRAVAEVGLEFKPAAKRAPKEKRAKKARKTTAKKTETAEARQSKKKPSA